MRLSKTQTIGFQKKIFTWWRKNKRDLPWRHTLDPYNIFVSEVMLQQTQVFRVVPKYRELVKRYPTVTDLSRASTADVLRAWKGMGYNKRALYLKKAAEEIVTYHKGVFPSDTRILRTLSGVGEYTAAAIQVFAYKKDLAMVDTNIRRIITHFFFQDKPQKEVVIQGVAKQLVPENKSWEWHQALMDYGAIERSKLNCPERSRRTSIPFKQSDRYFRGKILDDLRLKPQRMGRLKKKYISQLLISDERIIRILLKLKNDGLVEIIKDMVRLPI